MASAVRSPLHPHRGTALAGIAGTTELLAAGQVGVAVPDHLAVAPAKHRFECDGAPVVKFCCHPTHEQKRLFTCKHLH